MRNTFQDAPPCLLRTLPGHAGAETGGGTEVETCGARPLMGDRGLRPLREAAQMPVRAVGCGDGWWLYQVLCKESMPSRL